MLPSDEPPVPPPSRDVTIPELAPSERIDWGKTQVNPRITYPMRARHWIVQYQQDGKACHLARAWHLLRWKYEPFHKNAIDALAATIFRRDCLRVVLQRLIDGERDPETIGILTGEKSPA
jgi:hypothetical protein